MKYQPLAILICSVFLIISCKNGSTNPEAAIETAAADSASLSYQSENLVIQRLSNHTYLHTSFLNTNDFGRVSCNGLIVVNEKEAIVFDSPTSDEGSAELIQYISGELQSKINAIVPTHFHEDCVGGLEKFNSENIPAFASGKTVALLEEKDRKFSRPMNTFDSSYSLRVGDKQVHLQYFGEGHTKDNIIAYFPEDEAIFGGCLIKELGAGKGHLDDANTAAWPGTVRKIKQTYPRVKIVVPGHGKPGGVELLDYTITLFN